MGIGRGKVPRVVREEMALWTVESCRERIAFAISTSWAAWHA